MKKILPILFAFCAVLFLAGCVSGDRLARNTPFASGNNSFYRDGVNLFPLYYNTQKNNAGETATDYEAKIISTDIKSIIAAD